MRRLPSILGSGLWRALDRERIGAGAARRWRSSPTSATNCSTASAPTRWRRGCGRGVQRLADRGGRRSRSRACRWRASPAWGRCATALRTLYVPGCRLTLAELKAAADRLDDELRTIAAELRRGGRRAAGRVVWPRRDPRPPPPPRRPLARGLRRLGAAAAPSREGVGRRAGPRLGSRAAEVRSLARVMRFTRQPVLRLPDLRLWLY